MSDNSENTSSQDQELEIKFKVVRKQGEVKPLCVNHFVIQADKHEFHVRFYQMVPPIILGKTSEEQMKELESLGGEVEANCVAHLVFSNGRMKEFVNVLSGHVTKNLTEDFEQPSEERSNG